MTRVGPITRVLKREAEERRRKLDRSRVRETGMVLALKKEGAAGSQAIWRPPGAREDKETDSLSWSLQEGTQLCLHLVLTS